MKFNVYFLLRGAAATVWAPNKGNPVEHSGLGPLLAELAMRLPGNGLVECIGIRAEVASDTGLDEQQA